MASSDCPNEAHLKDYVGGDVSDELMSVFELHLETCVQCCAALETLERRGDTLLSGLRNVDSASDVSQEAALVEALELARQMTPSHVASQVATSDPALADAPRPELDDYEILHRLGHGGMGQVYKARHRRLDQSVAVKFLADHRLDTAAATRFHREMQAVGKLDHANIVRALDAREENDTPFLVMEYVDGIDIAALIRQLGPLAVADACEIVRQAAKGLQHAHERGLVHRDVKPSNLMLAGSGQRSAVSGQEEQREANVKIVDFGLAKLTEGVNEQSELTESRHILGTLDYMAPEQWDASGTVDIRADLYSLGCTLYFLLTGAPPFAAEQFDSRLKKMKAHAEAPPPPIAERRPDVPNGLSEIIERMLSKCPEDRQETPADVVQAIKPFVSGSDLLELLRRADLDTGAATESGRRLLTRRVTPWRILLVMALLVLCVAAGTIFRIKPRSGNEKQRTVAPLSPVALVKHPLAIAGLRSWSIETIGHRGPINDLAYSPDGELLATAGADGTIRCWNWRTRRLVRVMIGQPAEIGALEFSPDGSLLASGDQSGNVLFWNINSGRIQHEWKTDHRIFSLAWSPHGRFLAVGGGEGLLALLDGEHRESPRTFAAVGENVHDVAWRSDSQFATGNLDGKIRIWDAASGDVLQTLSAHQQRVWSLAWSPDATRLASGSDDRMIKIWDVERGEVLETWDNHGSGVCSVVWSDDGTRIASAEISKTMRIWDVGSGAEMASSECGYRARLRWSPDGEFVTAGAYGGEVIFWAGKATDAKHRIDGHEASANSLQWLSGDALPRSFHGDSIARTWEQMTEQPDPAKSWKTSVWRPDGEQAAWWQWGEEVHVGNPLSGTVSRKLPVADETWGLAWSPTAHRLAAGSFDGTVKVWDTKSWQLLHDFRSQDGRVWTVAFSPDGLRLVAGGASGIKIWDTETGQIIAEGTADDVVLDVDWSPDGRSIAGGESFGGEGVRIWDSTTGDDIGLLRHDTLVRAVAWSPDGKIVASGDTNGVLRLSRIRLPGTVQGYSNSAEVLSVAWSPEGELVSWGCRDGVIRIARPDSPDILMTFVAVAGGRKLAISPNGQYCCSAGVEEQLIYVTETDTGQEFFTAEQFAARYGWQNDPSQVRFGSVSLGSAADATPVDREVPIRGDVELKASRPTTDGTKPPATARQSRRSWNSTSAVVALVTNPTRIDGVNSWTVETRGHRGKVYAVAISPDGNIVATGGVDGAIRLWNPHAQDLTRILVDRDGWWLTALDFSPSGSTLAAGTKNGRVVLWDVDRGRRTTSFAAGEAIFSLDWSPDGKLLAVCGWNSVIIWNVEMRQTVATFPEAQGPLGQAAWHRDGNQLAVGDQRGTVWIWELESRTVLRRLAGHTGRVMTLAWSPDGTQIASGGKDNTIKVRDVETGDVRASWEAHATRIESVAWSHRGDRLASVGYDRFIRVWSPSDGKLIATMAATNPYTNVMQVTWNHDDALVAASTGQGTVFLWNAEETGESVELPGVNVRVGALQWLDNDSAPRSFHETGQVRCWFDIVTYDTPLVGSRFGAWRPDGKIAAWWATRQMLSISNPLTPVGTQLNGHTAAIEAFAWTRDGTRLATGSRDGTAKIWNAEVGQLDADLRGHRGTVMSVDWSPDDDRLVTGDADGVKVWDAETGDRLLEMASEKGITTVAWCPDGRAIASGQANESGVDVWDSTTGRRMHAIPG
ncbi:MAG: protein kinase [Planctomycetes bacterium]|nr:protein kinase [Planctomycetota bacterium]MBL7043247.1 protein kinase [Pirellulaceae bacterium]